MTTFLKTLTNIETWYFIALLQSTSWRAERAFFGRKAADRERNPKKDFFESLSTLVQWKKFLTLSSKLGMKTTLSKQEKALAETVC